MDEFKILTDEQAKKVRIFLERINEVEGNDITFDEETIYLLEGTYGIIEKMGGGDPIKAAEWRLGLTSSAK